MCVGGDGRGGFRRRGGGVAVVVGGVCCIGVVLVVVEETQVAFSDGYIGPHLRACESRRHRVARVAER